jgi:hypothetical protein
MVGAAERDIPDSGVAEPDISESEVVTPIPEPDVSAPVPETEGGDANASAA